MAGAERIELPRTVLETATIPLCYAPIVYNFTTILFKIKCFTKINFIEFYSAHFLLKSSVGQHFGQQATGKALVTPQKGCYQWLPSPPRKKTEKSSLTSSGPV